MQIPPGWIERENTIVRRYEFDDFASALAFVDKVGALAESANHHPDLAFGWGYAEVTLTTHSQGKVTEKDIALAEAIDAAR